jgi:hypothetical protein
MTLEQLLNELARYGRVSLSQPGTGDNCAWQCRLYLFVPGRGVSMQVDSDFNAKDCTAMQAALQCSDRLVAALNEMRDQSRSITLPTIG